MIGYILVVFLLLCSAYIVLPTLQEWFHYLVLKEPLEPSKPEPQQPVVNDPGFVMSKIEVPEGIEAYAASWSEGWAQDEAIDRAKRLWMGLGNWELVMQELERQDKAASISDG